MINILQKVFLFLIALAAYLSINAQLLTQFKPGQVWNDTSGDIIQAHGGGILYHNSTWYWYGENKDAPNNQKEGKPTRRVDVIGVSCYSSTDLYNWKYEGIVLPAGKDKPEHDLHPSGVLERPKVIYNNATRKFVMLMHIDKADYKYARIGFAIADKPTGPFIYKYSIRPGGCDSRDMTVFKDDDGKAYVFYSSEMNKTMHVMALSEDYLQPVGDIHRIFVNRSREAPAVFKCQGNYYMITSGCTGWNPNAAECAVTGSVMGQWKVLGNPCTGKNSEITYHGQSTFVFPVPGKTNRFIFMADQWKPYDLRNSGYVWLPLEVDATGNVKIIWEESWDWKGYSFFSGLFEKETYKLPEEELVQLSEKIKYKETPQGDLYMYMLGPRRETATPLPAIVYFSGGGWLRCRAESQLSNAAWFRDKGINYSIS